MNLYFKIRTLSSMPTSGTRNIEHVASYNDDMVTIPAAHDVLI